MRSRLAVALTFAVALASPAFADTRCPAELIEAIEQLEDARMAHQDARSTLYQRDWKAHIGAARDRDSAVEEYESAREEVGQTRREKRQAKKAYRQTVRKLDVDTGACTASTPLPRWLTPAGRTG